ncbi:MAG: hypothetical protein IH956_07445, partial [Chloroflexi bacterium]|nr:hypothetical protein [Chloroflexota bacterium]
AAVGTEEAVVPPEGAQVVELDYEDRTVLPGLIDCHVHLIGIGDGRMGDELATLPDEVLALQAARNARAHLYSSTAVHTKPFADPCHGDGGAKSFADSRGYGDGRAKPYADF